MMFWALVTYFKKGQRKGEEEANVTEADQGERSRMRLKTEVGRNHAEPSWPREGAVGTTPGRVERWLRDLFCIFCIKMTHFKVYLPPFSPEMPPK